MKKKTVSKPYRDELLKEQKEGYLVSESLAYLNRNARYYVNPNFCQTVRTMEVI
jgi:hypothetical protein